MIKNKVCCNDWRFIEIIPHCFYLRRMRIYIIFYFVPNYCLSIKKRERDRDRDRDRKRKRKRKRERERERERGNSIRIELACSGGK